MKTKFLPDTIAPPTYRAVAPQQLWFSSRFRAFTMAPVSFSFSLL
jgi:hypothetical protein